MSRLITITYKPQHSSHLSAANSFERVVVESAQLLSGYGIEGDRKGGHPKRQLNLMSTQTLANLASQGYDINPGALGEQLVIDGIDVDSLLPGTCLQLGESACIEVTMPRAGCQKLACVQDVNASREDQPLGVMAKVIQGGAIHTGDIVTILETEPSHVRIRDH